VIARTPLHRVREQREVAPRALVRASDDSSFFTGRWSSLYGGLFIG
jgi:hypothetical protein